MSTKIIVEVCAYLPVSKKYFFKLLSWDQITDLYLTPSLCLKKALQVFGLQVCDLFRAKGAFWYYKINIWWNAKEFVNFVSNLLMLLTLPLLAYFQNFKKSLIKVPFLRFSQIGEEIWQNNSTFPIKFSLTLNLKKNPPPTRIFDLVHVWIGLFYSLILILLHCSSFNNWSLFCFSNENCKRVDFKIILE